MGKCEVCKVVCKVYFTFWKRGEKVGNNPINILRLPDLHVHLLAVDALVSLVAAHVTEAIVAEDDGAVLHTRIRYDELPACEREADR